MKITMIIVIIVLGLPLSSVVLGAISIGGHTGTENQTQTISSDPGPDTTIIVPVTVHLVRDETKTYTSTRNDENIKQLITEANRILLQASIYIDVKEIVETNLESNAIPSALNGNYMNLFEHQNYNPDHINIYLAQSLNGINGLALTGANIALVADRTSVNDYRTTAHELGHLFGLRHVDQSNRLMARGRNGEQLSNDEIQRAHRNAQRIVAVINGE